tara:strand:- start:280 stop:606 length:327 start_codon:yes stop_codon:yes gene_type:complete
MTYVFDIDGTICTLTDGDYSKAKPIKDRIEKVNDLYSQGNYIIFYTARGMGRFKNDKEKAISTFYDFTVKQLHGWSVRYNELHLGKPAGNLYIDDKGIKDEDFFNTRD